MTQDMDWQGKVALVTGGSSGIGLAVASALVARGANVVITGRNRDRLAQAADHQKSIEAVVASGSPEDHAAEVVKKALGKWGRLDLLVNNAGAGHPMPVDAYTADAIAAICAVNITTPSLLVKEAQASLRQTGGAIVNISTAVSRNAAPALAHYAATKAALEHLTRSWAIELAEAGIRVNAVAPGPVKTGALTGMMGLPLRPPKPSKRPRRPRSRSDDAASPKTWFPGSCALEAPAMNG